jgi:hypothetical protein
LPVEGLVARSEELAKEWAIALIAARPLQGIGELPLEELAEHAPRLLVQAIRALGSEPELDYLIAAAPLAGRDEPGPARALATISGASDAVALVGAVEALRSVLWQALLREQGWQAPGNAAMRQVSDLSERLACVCAGMLRAALESLSAAPRPAPAPGQEEPQQPRGAGELARDAPPGGAVIVDERVETPPWRAPSEPAVSAPAAQERQSARDPLPPDTPSQPEPEPEPEHRLEPAFAWDEARVEGGGREEIAIRDARSEEGPVAWIGLIGGQLELLQQDGRSFAVLLVEPREIEHLRAGERHSEMLRLAEELEDALAIAFGAAPHDQRAAPAPGRASLTRERPGRYWLLATDTDRAGAASLAERLRRAVATVVEHRGEPLDVVIGTALCPDDGRTAAALAAHADVSLYAARAAARAERGLRAAVREQ